MRCSSKFKWCSSKCYYYSNNSRCLLKLMRREVPQHSMLLCQISLHLQKWTQNSLEAILNITRLEEVINTKIISLLLNNLLLITTSNFRLINSKTLILLVKRHLTSSLTHLKSSNRWRSKQHRYAWEDSAQISVVKNGKKHKRKKSRLQVILSRYEIR